MGLFYIVQTKGDYQVQGQLSEQQKRQLGARGSGYGSADSLTGSRSKGVGLVSEEAQQAFNNMFPQGVVRTSLQ